MACMEEKLAYPGKRLGMEDTTLTLEQVEHMRPAPKTISSVRIREFDDSTANPEPIAQDEEADQLLEEFLSPSKLRSLTGFANLEEVEYLEMRVDTRENSLGNFGGLVPNLTELKLSNSIIATVRDLGTSLTNLRTLWLSRSGLSDLDGISSVSSLKELYLAFNHIEDVSPVSMLDQLEILDLEGNNVSDITQVEFLCLCSSLKILTLEGNPICTAPHPLTSPEEIPSYDYRSAIHKAVPNVKILDDEPFLVEKVDGKPVLREPPASHRANKVPEHLKADWQLVNDGIKAINLEEEEENSFDVARPGSAAGARQNRPSSAMSTRQRPMSASRQRPSSAMGQRPGSAGGGAEPVGVFHQDDSSDLTHGSSQVICGNISRALKSRQKDLKTPKMPVVAFLESPRLYTPEKSFEEDAGPSASKQDILEELKAWREDFSKMLSEERSTISKSEDKSRTSDSELPKSSPAKEPPTTPTYSPSPPSSRRPGSPSAVRRSLPTPPLVGREMLNRPNTAADFRIRRFRQLSGETNVNQLRLRSLHGDESFEVDKNSSTPSLDTRPSPALQAEQDSEPRSSSAPVRVNRRPRDVPPTKDGTRPSRKLPDPPLLGQRPGTAAAALQKRRLRPSQE